MPKMKTHSGAKKRFKITGSGKIKRQQANRRHQQREGESHDLARAAGKQEGEQTTD